MSACYSVKFIPIFKDSLSKSLAASKLLQYGFLQNAYCDECKFNKNAHYMNLFDNMISLFGFDEMMFTDDNKPVYCIDSNASYGYEGIFLEIKNLIIPYLEENSTFNISVENNYTNYKLQNGKWIIVEEGTY